MKPRPTTGVVFALLAGCAMAAAVGAETVASGISGAVLNATCPGPCSIPPPPLPRYEGDGLTVVIRTLPERELVARLFPTDGSFGIEVPPGLYRVRAFIGDPRKPNCWEGSTRRVTVEDGAVTRVRLRVRNVCVV